MTMRRHWRLTTGTVAVAAAAVVLAGCAGGSGGGDGDSAEPADSGTVTWWGWTPDTPVAERYIEEFNKEYPDIEVTYKNYENVDFRNAITPALDSGQGPDVFDLSAAGGSPDTYGPYALDLTSFAEETLGEDWASQFGAGWTDQLTDADGRLVSLPLGGMTAGMIWYNQDLLDQAGATVPTDYDSWVDTCEKVAAIGKTCFAVGAGGTDTFPTDLYHAIANSVDPEFFGQAATGEAAWNDPAGIEVLEIVQRMREDGIIASNALDAPQYPLANDLFMKGDAAMVQMGFWYAQYARGESATASREAAGASDSTPFVQLPAEFPDVAGQGNGSEYFGEVDYGLAINADSPNIGAAKTFVRWLTMTEAGQQNVANAIDLLPALQGVAPDWENVDLVDPAVQQPAIEQLMTDSAAAEQTRQWQTSTDTLDAIVVGIQQVLDPSGGASIQEIADGMQATAVPSTVGTE